MSFQSGYGSSWEHRVHTLTTNRERRRGINLRQANKSWAIKRVASSRSMKPATTRAKMAFVSPLPVLSTAAHTRTWTNSPRRNTVCSKKSSRVTCTASPISNPNKSQTETLVDQLLLGIQDTNFGARVPAEKRQHLDQIFQQLVVLGQSQTPMSDPRLFGNYQVAYTSTKEKSPPAGGRSRSLIGQLLLPTRGLFQHVLQPNIVINLVCFKMLGLLKGSVSLRGKLSAIDDSTIGANAIQVIFDRPRLCFGKAVFEVGPITQVKLRTVYLDERVRLAIGSRGSLFVFTKGGEADSDMADEYKHVYSSKPLPTVLLSFPAVAVICVSLFSHPALRFIAVGLMMTFFGVLRRGGTSDRAPGIVAQKK